MCYDWCNNNLKGDVILNNEVELITCESGDWVIIKLNGDIIEEGHSIPSTSWLRLLDKLNVSTSMKKISDEAMENRDF